MSTHHEIRIRNSSFHDDDDDEVRTTTTSQDEKDIDSSSFSWWIRKKNKVRTTTTSRKHNSLLHFPLDYLVPVVHSAIWRTHIDLAAVEALARTPPLQAEFKVMTTAAATTIICQSPTKDLLPMTTTTKIATTTEEENKESCTTKINKHLYHYLNNNKNNHPLNQLLYPTIMVSMVLMLLMELYVLLSYPSFYTTVVNENDGNHNTKFLVVNLCLIIGCYYVTCVCTILGLFTIVPIWRMVNTIQYSSPLSYHMIFVCTELGCTVLNLPIRCFVVSLYTTVSGMGCLIIQQLLFEESVQKELNHEQPVLLLQVQSITSSLFSLELLLVGILVGLVVWIIMMMKINTVGRIIMYTGGLGPNPIIIDPVNSNNYNKNNNDNNSNNNYTEEDEQEPEQQQQHSVFRLSIQQQLFKIACTNQEQLDCSGNEDHIGAVYQSLYSRHNCLEEGMNGIHNPNDALQNYSRLNPTTVMMDIESTDDMKKNGYCLRPQSVIMNETMTSLSSSLLSVNGTVRGNNHRQELASSTLLDDVGTTIPTTDDDDDKDGVWYNGIYFGDDDDEEEENGTVQYRRRSSPSKTHKSNNTATGNKNTNETTSLLQKQNGKRGKYLSVIPETLSVNS